MENKLDLNNIEKSFKNKKIIKNITYSFSNGIYGLLGPNGAGKTTLMRCIAGLYGHESGSILYNGVEIDKIREYGKVIGYLPQKFGLFKELTVIDLLRYFSGLKDIPDDKVNDEIINCLRLVNLEEHKREKCKKLSGGMVRRLGIAQAVLGNPGIVIFDEPTTGLDPEERLRFKLLLKKMEKNMIVIVSTHIVEDVEAACNNIIIMNDGKLIETCTIEQLKNAAEGKVYEVLYSETENLLGEYYISKQYEKNNEIYCRVLSSNGQSFDKLEPLVEDGYICRIKNI